MQMALCYEAGGVPVAGEQGRAVVPLRLVRGPPGRPVGGPRGASISASIQRYWYESLAERLL